MKNEYSNTWFEIFLESIGTNQLEKEILFPTNFLPNSPFRTVLDIYCGQGRHTNILACKGYFITGIDLNQEALEKAKQNSNHNAVYKNIDMRKLEELPGQFDAVINLWQSFGYFDDTTNRDILKIINQKLNPKERFILDIYYRNFFEKYQGTRQFIKKGIDITPLP